jgi:hypothetical protein
VLRGNVLRSRPDLRPRRLPEPTARVPHELWSDESLRGVQARRQLWTQDRSLQRWRRLYAGR